MVHELNRLDVPNMFLEYGNSHMSLRDEIAADEEDHGEQLKK